jgi:hypothetical protein
MESPKLPFQYWFIAFYLMTGTKNDISAHQMRREPGHKRYEPVWAMIYKTRMSMGKRDSNYLLAREVGIDEQKDEPRKLGKESQKQTMFMVFAVSTEVKPSKRKEGRPSRRCGYFKMLACADMSMKTPFFQRGLITLTLN